MLRRPSENNKQQKRDPDNETVRKEKVGCLLNIFRKRSKIFRLSNQINKVLPPNRLHYNFLITVPSFWR